VISVIIVNYGSALLTKRAVDSVFCENEKTEVFVVDNTADAEESERLLAMFAGLPVALLFNETNIGFGRACNRAYALSKGDYIFLLNPDAYIVPPCLLIMREFLERKPGAGSVSPLTFWDSMMTYFFPRPLLPSPCRDLTAKLSDLSQVFGSLYSLLERRKNIGLWKSSSPVRVKNISGGAAFLRRTAIEDCGGLFDERFFLFYEDSDLFLRMQKKGYHLYIIPSARAVHRHKHLQEKIEIMTETQKIFYGKHFKGLIRQRVISVIPDAPRARTYLDLGSWSTPPLFPVPERLRKRYLFEWSPSPLFIPAVGHFGAGKDLLFSPEVWDSIGSGEYYSRFTDGDKTLARHEILRWRKN
jgi:GT2 family glycosyltransferase